MTWPEAVNPGRLDRKIDVQVQSLDTDTVGEQHDVWTTIISDYAEIRTATGKELFMAGQRTAQVSHVVTMRWPRQLVWGGMRVRYIDLAGASPPIPHYYHVQWIDNLMQRNVYLVLYCMERNASE